MAKIKNEHFVRLARITLSLGAIQAVTYLLPFLALPYLARTLGVDGFGKLALATAICAILNSVVDYGFDLTATRDVSRAASDVPRLKRILVSVLLAKCLLILVSLFLLLVVMATSDKMRDDAVLLALSFLIVPATALVPTWYFQGIQHVRPLLIAQVISKILALVGIFVFVKSPDDILLVPIAYAVPQLVVGAALLSSVFFQMRNCREAGGGFGEAVRQLREGFDVFLNVFSPNLYSNFSVYLLGLTGGAVSVALLDSARKVISVADQALNTLMRAIFPSLAINSIRHRTFALVVMGAGLAAAVISFFSADVAMLVLFGAGFEGGAVLLRILAVGIIGFAAKISFGTGFLVPLGNTVQLRNITIASALAGMVVALLAVPSYGAVGAAMAILLGRGLQGTMFFLAYKAVSREQ